jgi:taurine transport system permease protein
MSEGQQQRSQARRRYTFLAVLSPLAILLVWSLLTFREAVPAVILPSPLAVAASLWDMVLNGYSGVSIWVHIGYSLMRVGVAFVLGSVLGIVIGLLRGRAEVVDALFVVPSEILRPIPPLGLIPLFILWFGIGELSKITLIFVFVLLIMMVNAQAGANAVGLDTLRAAQSMGANRWQVFRFVVLPSALPQIMTGLRIAMGTALTILVASELLGGDRGLGFVILDASSFFRTTYVFAGIILIGIIGLISDRAIADGGRLVQNRGRAVRRHRPAQHFEDDGRRPAEQQHAVHRGHRSEQLPFRRDVAIAERCVVHEGEIDEAATRRHRAGDQIGQRPDQYLAGMRGHQHQHRRDHHHDQERRPVGVVDRARPLRHPYDRGHDQGVDRDVAGADGGA